MLPGIRLLFAAFILSGSVLIFGLGAAALLRSAHEEFIGTPSWRQAQQLNPSVDTSRPALSMLRIEAAAPIRSSDDIATDIAKKMARNIARQIAKEEKKNAAKDGVKNASIEPSSITDTKRDDAALNPVEEAKPVVRKRRASAKRKRFARRTRAPVVAQQQFGNSDPFPSNFGASTPVVKFRR